MCAKHERLNSNGETVQRRPALQRSLSFAYTQWFAQRAGRFFIDPWSTAYWVRTTCNDKRDKVFIYSFGPNRARDSSKWKLGGDDIGVLFRVRKDEARRAENER